MTNERPENVWATTLPNGLRVRVLCKPDFQRSYAVFATCYGGADRRFRVGDTWTDTPAGVAHYLEHKLFDMPDGSDALLTLSENGADPNAFTSTNMTAYYFSCTDGFEENLRTLLRFVSTPYFTDASVAKEQGIIAQEIRMGEDDPDRAVWRNLMRCLMARDRGARRRGRHGREHRGDHARDALCLPPRVLRAVEHGAVRRVSGHARARGRHRGGDPAAGARPRPGRRPRGAGGHDARERAHARGAGGVRAADAAGPRSSARRKGARPACARRSRRSSRCRPPSARRRRFTTIFTARGCSATTSAAARTTAGRSRWPCSAARARTPTPCARA